MSKDITLSKKSLIPPELPIKLETISDEELEKELAKIDYSFYCEYVHRGQWKPAKHLNFVCDKLQKVESGEIKRLMIFMPPRHGKSMTVTETFPSYFIGKNPNRHVIEVSYGDVLAQRFGKFNRQKVNEYGEEIFGVKLSKEKSSMTDWDIDSYRGGMLSVGIGGGITGQGADLLIIDDPIKNSEEANSQTYRDKLWSEWEATLSTRLHPGAAVIVILTRWNEDDLAGRLLKAEPGEWDVVSLPAEAENNDLLERKQGELLWPDYGYDEEWAKKKKITSGTYVWTALFQQRPQSLQGGAFKAPWIKWYTIDQLQYNGGQWYMKDRPLKLYQGIDPATTQKTYSDDFCDTTIGVTPEFETYVLDVTSGQFDPGDQAKLISDTYQDWLPETTAIEDNGGQKYLVSEVKRYHLINPGTPRIPVKAITHTGDKYSRITSHVPYVESGGLYLRAALPGEDGFYDQDRLPGLKIHISMKGLYYQLVTFAANIPHDDIIDSLSIALEVGVTHGQIKFFENKSKEEKTNGNDKTTAQARN